MPAGIAGQASTPAVQPTSSAHYLRALGSASQGLHAEALQEIKEALRESGDFAEGYHERGRAYKNLGEMNKAVKAFRTAIRIQPERVESYIELASVYDATGNFLEAIKVYMEALRLQPNSIETRNDLGMAYFHVGSYAEASKAFSQALQIDEHNSGAHFGLGLIYVDTHRKEMAVDKYKVLKESGDHALASLLMDQIDSEFHSY